MGMPQLVVTAVLVEGRSKSEVAREYGVSRRWVITLVQRYLGGGDQGLHPRSRRPRRSPNRTGQDLEDEIIALRKQLERDGYEAGAATIAFHLQQRHGASPAVSTIWRILSARGFVTPQPHKRPKSSYVRFQAEQPNERWQLDITHWALADGTDMEILNILDDHSRLCVDSKTLPVFKAGDVNSSFAKAVGVYGNPASLLSDNGAVFTADKAALPWKSPCTVAASASATAAPTTRRPAAKSNASTKPSRNGSSTRPQPQPWRTYKTNSTPSAPTTTPRDHTAR
jgi:transposase